MATTTEQGYPSVEQDGGNQRGIGNASQAFNTALKTPFLTRSSPLPLECDPKHVLDPVSHVTLHKGKEQQVFCSMLYRLAQIKCSINIC